MSKDTMKAQAAAPAADATTAGQRDIKSFDRWRLAMIAGAMAYIGFYVLLYVQTGAWQLLIQVGTILVGLGCGAVAHTLIRRAKFDAAGYWMLIAVAVAYSSGELFFSGATLYLVVGGVLLNLLVGGLVIPRKWPVWLITAGLFGIFVWLVNLFEPLPRYDIAQSPLLNVILPGITGLLVLLTLWQIGRAFTIGNIRTRLLIAFVSLVLLTAVVTGVSSTATSFRGGRDQIIAQLESVATLKESEIGTWLNSLRAELNAVIIGANVMQRATVLLLEESPDPASYQDAYSKLQGRFQQSVETAELYEELFLMDTRGQVVMSTNPAQESKVYTEKTYFQRGLQAPYVQPPFYSPSLHRTSIIVARPVTDEQGQVLGVLAGRASMDKLSAVMNERAGLGETGETYLVGANKALLTQLRFAETGTSYARTEGINAAIDDHVNGSGLYDDYRGAPIVGAYRWLPELEVALLAEQNQSEAFRAIYLTMGINLGITLLAVIVAVAVGLSVTRNIADPLADLTAMAAQFTDGDLTARARAASRDDEIGALATAFNTMAARVGELLTGLKDRGQELQARTREIEASQRVTFAASERTSPDALLNLVVNLMRDQFHLYHAQVYIVEDPPLNPPRERGGSEDSPPVLTGGVGGGRVAVLRQSTGYAGRRLLQRKHHIPLNQPALVTKAIHEGQPVVVDDVSQTADWLPNPLLPDTRSELVLPLKVGDQVIGVLDVQDRAPGRFTPGMVTLFQTMTDQVAFLFENSDLLDRVTERTQELTIFTEQLRTSADIARQLGAILDPDLLLQQVVELIRSRFGLYHAHIYVLEAPPSSPPLAGGTEGGIPVSGGEGEVKGKLVIRAGSGEVGRVLRERGHSIPLDAEKSLVARAARAREPVLVADTALESDFMPNPLLPQTRSEMAVPLLVGDKVLGVLDVQDDQPNRFTQAERDTFATLAGQIGTALQTAGLFAQVQARLRVGQALAGAQTEEEVIAGMMTGASFYPQAQVMLALYDQEAEEPTLVAQSVSSFESGVASVKVGARFPTSRFKLIEHLSPTEPLVISNLPTDERVDPTSRQFLTGLGVVSTAIINVTAGDEQIGVLRASSTQEGYFDERKLHLYQSIAEQGAIALRSGRLFDESQRTAERLRELDILKTEFMANMSHELRTPLNSIIGYTELMLMGVSEIDPDTLEDVQAIHENGQHLLHLINDILDMAKIESGSLALNFEQVQIAPLINEVSAKAVALLAGKPVEWTVEIEENLPPIWGDSLRLDQILNNLVSNAEKFTEEGAISLRAYAERAGDGDWVCVAIKDTGIGIAETDVTKIFDRFQQVDGSSTRRAGGTGLGLAITQQLVRLHGGTLKVESLPGEGATFTARLPVSE